MFVSIRLVGKEIIWTLLAACSLAFAGPSYSAEPDELAGTWVCLNRSYLVEFRDQKATFKGLNPFVQSQHVNTQHIFQYVEVTLPYSLVPDGAGVALEFDRAAFEGVRDQLKLLPVQAVHFNQPPFAFCNLAKQNEGEPAEMAFTIVPRNRIYRNEDKLRRLTEPELAEYAKLQGAWDVNILWDKEVIRSATVAIIPGWIFEKTKVWEPPLLLQERQYPERTISQIEIDPAKHRIKILEPVSLRGRFSGFSLMGSNTQPVNYTREHGLEYSLEGKSITGTMSSAFYKKEIEQWLSYFDIHRPEKPSPDAPANAEQLRFNRVYEKLIASKDKKIKVTLTATKIDEKPGENPLATWLRTIYPERPFSEQFTGKWTLKSHLQWEPGVKENEGYVDAPLNKPQDWIIGWDQIRVIRKDVEFDRTYSFSYFYDKDQGVAVAKDGRDVEMIYLKFRLQDDIMIVESGRTLNWPAAIDRLRPAVPERFVLVRQKD